MEIKQGQIWVVTTDAFLTSGLYNVLKRPVKIIKNELIEIRFPYPWHFRTLDNKYWHAKPECILENCKLFATVWKDVQHNNNCKLSDIINLSLCSFENGNSYNWAANFDYEFLNKMKLSNLLSSSNDKHKKPGVN